MAKAYADYWNRLKEDTDPPGDGGKAEQSAAFRRANGQPHPAISLEDNSGTVDMWFSPNTPTARGKARGADEDTPPDLDEVFEIIAKAQQAILFLAFEPGSQASSTRWQML